MRSCTIWKICFITIQINVPKYTVTVQSNIYQQILDEVDGAYSTPCELYFCCHGGDGAHTGVSHNDYVDIKKIAWLLTIGVFSTLLYIDFVSSE